MATGKYSQKNIPKQYWTKFKWQAPKRRRVTLYSPNWHFTNFNVRESLVSAPCPSWSGRTQGLLGYLTVYYVYRLNFNTSWAANRRRKYRKNSFFPHASGGWYMVRRQSMGQQDGGHIWPGRCRWVKIRLSQYGQPVWNSVKASSF